MIRIQATHVGSLPRSQAVVDFLFAKERGEAIDEPAFDACMADAVSETVRRQVDAGIDIVSDGETSKISYATYVSERYTGFAGDSPRQAPADLKMFPGYLDRIARSGGTPKYARPECVGEVRAKDYVALDKDIANLLAAMRDHGAARGFMNAASPGVIALFQPNRHYPSRRPISAPSPTRCAMSTKESWRRTWICRSTVRISAWPGTCSSRICPTTSSWRPSPPTSRP
jgi:5-methyltetrahydropteroyltriglutamate--homocysteine methyltransferase